MHERIHRYLDGDLPASALSSDELERVARLEEALSAAEDLLGPGSLPDLAPAVLASIERLEASGAQVATSPEDRLADPARAAAPRRPAPRGKRGAGSSEWLRRALSWLWTPRPIQVPFSPGLALAAVAAVLLFVALPDRQDRSDGAITAGSEAPAPVAGAADVAEQRVLVHFRLDAPDASRVFLAGDFTGWRPEHELHESVPGVWTIVVALDPGVHDYAFVVDGEHWRPDPLAAQVDDGFGGKNSRLSILPPGEAREI